MLKQLTTAVTVTAAALGLTLGPVQAGERVVLIELYTSQGCSSCPPADALLKELSPREDVIPLALHVDYWDYIGWKDVFADPAYADRQRAYARAAGQRTIYTPQMIVGGLDHVVGYKPMSLADAIMKHREKPPVAEIQMQRDGASVSIEISAEEPLGATIVQLVRYMPEATVAIKAGENRGETISYSNIVTEWRKLQDWDGASDVTLSAEAAGEQPVVVVLQKPGHGEVIAAARLR